MTIETDLAGLGMITIIFDPDDRHKCPPAAYNLTLSFEKQPACLPAEAAVTSAAIRTNPAKPGFAGPTLRAAEEEPDSLFSRIATDSGYRRGRGLSIQGREKSENY
jgi:hypothetical protein